MSARTPNFTTVRAAWCRAHPFWAITDVEERNAEFDRMIAEVERAAAQKAWDEGYTRGNAHNGRRDDCPYRRNEGEKE